jgi:hypothetical protein
MASVSTDAKGNKTMQFTGLDGKRKTLRVGKARERTVNTVKGHVEELLEARKLGRSPYDETEPSEAQEESGDATNSLECAPMRDCTPVPVGDTGFEPVTSAV